MQKLMAFDLDGTIVFDLDIEPKNLAAIHAWQQAGNLAVCASGKSIYAADLSTRGFDLTFDYNVLFTGAVVTDANYRVLYQRSLPKNLVQEVLAHLGTMPHLAIFATSLEQDFQIANTMDGESSNILPNFKDLPAHQIDQHEFIGIPIWAPDSKTREAAYTWIMQTYGKVIDCHRNQTFLDIVPKGCNKGAGLDWLVNVHLAGQDLETYTIGDSWNDLEMHRWADHSASFTYSPREVQKATQSVVEKTYDFINTVIER